MEFPIRFVGEVPVFSADINSRLSAGGKFSALSLGIYPFAEADFFSFLLNIEIFRLIRLMDVFGIFWTHLWEDSFNFWIW